MSCGHHPDEIDSMSIRDIELFVAAAPTAGAERHPLADVEDEPMSATGGGDAMGTGICLVGSGG